MIVRWFADLLLQTCCIRAERLPRQAVALQGASAAEGSATGAAAEGSAKGAPLLASWCADVRREVRGAGREAGRERGMGDRQGRYRGSGSNGRRQGGGEAGAFPPSGSLPPPIEVGRLTTSKSGAMACKATPQVPPSLLPSPCLHPSPPLPPSLPLHPPPWTPSPASSPPLSHPSQVYVCCQGHDGRCEV